MPQGLLYGNPNGYTIGSPPKRRDVDRSSRPVLPERWEYLTAAQRAAYNKAVKKWEVWYRQTSEDEERDHKRKMAIFDKRLDKVRALAASDAEKVDPATLRYFEAYGFIPPGASDLQKKLDEIANERYPEVDE